MGTNYYAYIDICEHCGRSDPAIHLGKSSVGWRFCIEIQKEYYINWHEFNQFIRRINVTIRDEYNDTVAADDLVTLIMNKGKYKHHEGNLYDGPVDLADYEFS